MRVCIAVSSLSKNDAIGNDVCHQCLALRRMGVETFIHAEQGTEGYMAGHRVGRGRFLEMLDAPETRLIYHHGGDWLEGPGFLERARGQVYVKYHNVTPPEFFAPYNDYHAGFCRAGIFLTEKFARMGKGIRFLCDSPHNVAEIAALGVPEERIAIVPPFHKLDDFASAPEDAELARALDNGKINVLFVGRVAPNKGHRHLIEVMARYVAMYGPGIRLNVVGGIDPSIPGYNEELEKLVRRRGLGEVVTFTGGTTFAELSTYYRHSDLFLLMSEHEGFCLPVLEAQHHDLPILALSRAAVPGTMGANQMLFETPDYRKFAAAIHVLDENEAYRRYLVGEGRKNLERLSNGRIEEAFFRNLGIAVPPGGKPGAPKERKAETDA